MITFIAFGIGKVIGEFIGSLILVYILISLITGNWKWFIK